MRRLTCVLAAAVALAGHAAGSDATADSSLFRGSSAEPPPDVFLVKKDLELAGISLLPVVAALAGRQQQQCPYPVMCSARSCCPSGYKCCNAAAPPLCCPATSACRLDVGNCCPDTAVTCGGRFCAQPGAVCCGTSVCAPGTACNTSGGTVSCCRPGELRCLGTCCPAGSQCAPQTGYCRRLTLSDKSTTTETTTTTTTRQSTTTSTRTTTTVISSRTTSTSTSTACAANRRDLLVEPRQNSRRPNCAYECHNGQTLPVVEVPNIPGQTDQLFVSMCSGILGTSAGRRGDGSNFDVLTYRGADGKALRRSQARCKGYCAEQKAVFGDPASLQCDEYPPAMAGEGGKGAFRVCIPNAQNSGAQGRLFRRFVTDCAPEKGKPFVVRMKGGCNVRNGKRAPPPLPQLVSRADAAATTTTYNASSNVLYSWDNLTYMYVPLPALQNGHYRIDVRFRGSVRGVQVTDSDGEDYYATTGAAVEDGHVVEFDVAGVDAQDGEQEPDPLPAGLFLDVDEAVDVSYEAQATLNGTKTGEQSSAVRAAALSAVMLVLVLVVAAVVV
ncbi:NADP-specific glutamate dehydrogenase [Cordyceps militaris]|uniref:NADP-specific glutamate dehydrogenase n=1 Tax=Cordyceps militaris TaxID=73501 RepID=A0A2H4SL78_CORMI|nr:NADP-specific glutamate dehydrogenase [Cordyceps militaris]